MQMKEEAAQVKQELEVATEKLQSARISPIVAAVQKRRPVPSSLLPPATRSPAAAVGMLRSQPGGDASAACHEWATTGPATAGLLGALSSGLATSMAVQHSANKLLRTGSHAESALVPNAATNDRGLPGPSQHAALQIVDLSDEACNNLEPSQPHGGGGR